MQIKIIMSDYYTLIRTAKIKNSDDTKCRQGSVLYTAGGNIKWRSNPGNSSAVSDNTKRARTT